MVKFKEIEKEKVFKYNKNNNEVLEEVDEETEKNSINNNINNDKNETSPSPNSRTKENKIKKY